MRKLVLWFVLFFSLSFLAQTKLDTLNNNSNIILFAEFDIGYANFSRNSFSGGVSLNYQNKSDFFKFRFTENLNTKGVERVVIFFPVSGTQTVYHEYALMYGKRYIKKGFSYHFTAGISYNTISTTNFESLFNSNTESTNFYGFPLEIGFNWFSPDKEQFRIFGLIPIGKPSNFSRATGMKIKANLTEQYYVGLSLSLGFGFYKS